MSSDWPMSILPKKAVTRPSGATATHESSSVGTSAGLLSMEPVTEPDAERCARASPAAALTINAPEALRNSRREIGAFMIVSSGHLRLGALDCAQNRHVRSAAALQAGQRVAQLAFARLGILFQVRGRGHDPAVDAVAALRHLLLDVRYLQRMRLLGGAQPFQSGDFLARDRGDGHDA